jgi:hypothetical protein
MPAFGSTIPFFIMFGGSTMGVRRKFVLLGRLPVCLVHGAVSCRSVDNAFYLHEVDQPLCAGECSHKYL